jgi:lipid-binding SYLF domain-containing protein
MKKGVVSLLTVVLVLSLSAWAQTSSTSDTGKKYESSQNVMKRMDDSIADLNRLTNSPDNGIPQTILAKAKCVAIVPSLIKGGFIFGAQHGRGVATCRVPGNENRWSAPAFFTMTGGSWGAQIGAEGIDLVMLFMTDERANKLMAANWKIGGDVGAAVGPYGRDLSANTDWKLDTGILTYSRSKGAFIGATLNGVNVHVDTNAMRALYGQHPPSFQQVLTGKVPAPAQARQFLASIRQNFHEAEASK